MAARNAKVYIGARSNEKGSAAVTAVKLEHVNATVDFVRMDMMDLNSVVEAATNIKRYMPTFLNQGTKSVN